VAGDVSFGALADLASGHFGDWNADGPGFAPPVPRAQRPLGIRDHVVLAGDTPSELIVGGPTIGSAEPGFRALLLGTLMLGQFGLGGRLGARLREAEGLAYECYASLEDVPTAALWTARASVRPADLGRAARLIVDEIRRLRTELVPDAELAACKSACLGGMALAAESNAGLSSILQNVALSGLELDWLVRLADEIRQLSPQDIQAAAREWLDEEHLLIVSAGRTL
jgi:zinc protease